MSLPTRPGTHSKKREKNQGYTQKKESPAVFSKRKETGQPPAQPAEFGTYGQQGARGCPPKRNGKKDSTFPRRKTKTPALDEET